MLFVSVRHTKQPRWTSHLINEETAEQPRSWVAKGGLGCGEMGRPFNKAEQIDGQKTGLERSAGRPGIKPLTCANRKSWPTYLSNVCPVSSVSRGG